MEKQAIAETVQKCGEYAYAAGEAAEVTLSLENDNAIRGRQVQWMQAKMLGEIAYQLAMLNERVALEDQRLQDQVTGQSLMITALEVRVDKLDGRPAWPKCAICGIDSNLALNGTVQTLCYDHHPKGRSDTPPPAAACRTLEYDCRGYMVGNGCTCSPEVKRKRWEEAVPSEQRGRE